MLFGLDLDSDKKKSKNGFDVFGDGRPLRKNKTMVQKETELSRKKKPINNIMNTLSEGSEESESSETHSVAT